MPSGTPLAAPAPAIGPPMAPARADDGAGERRDMTLIESPAASDLSLDRAALHASTTFSRDLLASLQRFRDGDFSSRMPGDLVGIDGKIADVFNEILSVSARRAEETARVSRVVGKEGKLKE